MPAPANQDIYSRNAPQFNGAYAADSSLISFSGLNLAGAVGLITQQIGVQYRQNVMRVYELGTVFQYFVVGRAQGSANLSRVLGPRPVIFSFYSIYGNACNAGTNTITFSMSAGCSSPTDLQATNNLRFLWMTGVVLTDLSFSAQAEQMIVNEQSQAMFVALIPEAGQA